MKAQRASVLIVVLWASLGLVSVALLFGHSMLMAYRGADNDVAGRQADQAIEGAVRYVRVAARESRNAGLVARSRPTRRGRCRSAKRRSGFSGGRRTRSSGTTREFGAGR